MALNLEDPRSVRIGLRRFKDDLSEVEAGFEGGVSISGYNDIKAGDQLEAFVSEKVAAEL